MTAAQKVMINGVRTLKIFFSPIVNGIDRRVLKTRRPLIVLLERIKWTQPGALTYENMKPAITRTNNLQK